MDQERADQRPPRSSYWVAVADFSDGKSDLVTADNNGDTVSVLLRNGDGTFRAMHDFGTGSRPCSVAVGDISDGVKDLVTGNYNDNTASVLLGNETTAYGLQPITGVSVATQDDALAAQGQIDSYLESVKAEVRRTARQRFRKIG